jgi:hypothetical protein
MTINTHFKAEQNLVRLSLTVFQQLANDWTLQFLNLCNNMEMLRLSLQFFNRLAWCVFQRRIYQIMLICNWFICRQRWMPLSYQHFPNIPALLFYHWLHSKMHLQEIKGISDLQKKAPDPFSR